jgi:hypothetical protein
VVLLGQNVNSYWDVTSASDDKYRHTYELAEGFSSRKNAVKVKGMEDGDGVRFGELLARVRGVSRRLLTAH